MDSTIMPNELALSLAEMCKKWTYVFYSGEYEVNDVPRNVVLDRQYETRLERAITDVQTKIQSQKRVLDDVFPHYIKRAKRKLRKKAQEEEEKSRASLHNLSAEAKVC